jgi:hypothetical protein
MTNPRVPVLALLLVFWPGKSWLFAEQSPDQIRAPAVAPDETPASNLRAWLLPDESSSELSLRLQPPADAIDAPPRIFASSSGGEVVTDASYASVPAGPVSLELLDGGKIIARKSVSAPAGRFITVLCRETQSSWDFQVFDDGPARRAGGTAVVRLISMAKGYAARLTAGTNKPVAVDHGAVGEVRLPLEWISASVELVDNADKTSSSTPALIDLVASDSAYVTIVPDYRGRMRPEVVPGAPAPAPEAPPRAAVQVAAPTAEELRRDKLRRLTLDLEYNKSLLALLEGGESGPNKPADADSLRKEVEGAIREIASQIKQINTGAVQNR